MPGGCLDMDEARTRPAQRESQRVVRDQAWVACEANNEDSQCEALQVLLDCGCEVNTTWNAHTQFFAGALKAQPSPRTSSEMDLFFVWGMNQNKRIGGWTFGWKMRCVCFFERCVETLRGVCVFV